jgi:shikimate dehydrogenase
MINSSINGATSVYGIIGSPVEHSFSPVIHNTMAEQLSLKLAYVPFLVKEGEVETALKGAYALNIQGLNVTVPHKKAVIEHLCALDKRAEAIGAVNTLKYTKDGYIGYNTDVIGVEYAITHHGYDIKDKSVLLLGAGGAANACAVMSAYKGCSVLYIANRTVERAQELADRVSKYYPDTTVVALALSDIDTLDKVDVVLNSTTIGFGEHIGQSPVKDKSFFKAKGVQLVFDAIYSPWETQLIKDAEAEGIDALNGFDMLVYQAVAAEEIWQESSFDNELIERLRATLSTFYRSGK